MTKKAIRKEFIEKRLKLSSAEIQKRSAEMVKHFEEMPLPPVKNVLSYYPLLERNEFNIDPCIQYIKRKLPDVRIAWPKINDQAVSMEAHTISEDALYTKNKYGILEPLTGEKIHPELLDMVFVPMVMSDEKGYRVGYGKGYYDRYLPRCRADLIKVGFSFFEPGPIIEDIDEFDVPLNYCITPSRMYEF